MNIAQTVLEYQTMQAAAEQMVKNMHPSVTWVEGEFLRDTLWDSDIHVDVDGDTMSFDGSTWHTVLGNSSEEAFCFTIPVDVFTKVVEARLTAASAECWSDVTF